MYRLIILVGLFFFLVFPSSSFAQENGIRVSPAFLEVELDEAESEKEVEIEIENLTNETISLDFFAIDFRQANELGGVDFLGVNSQDYSYSLASFISFETTSITLEKGESQSLNVTITNRPDLSPGGHYAAIVGNLEGENDRNEESALVKPAVSSLILLRKSGGEVFSISLLETNWPNTLMFGFPNRQLQLLLQNEGNVHLIPYGTVTIKDIFGKEIAKGSINNASSIILPEARRWVDVRLDEINYSLPFSFVTMDIKGRDSIDKTTFVYSQTAILINPILLAILVLISGITIFYLKKRKNAKKA